MAYSGGYDWQARNRQLLHEGTEALERTGESLARSNQIAIETEIVGTNVLSELNEQRESLIRTRDRVENMNDGLSRSNRIINAMNKHVFYNKLILIIIIILEVLILGALIAIKFIIK